MHQTLFIELRDDCVFSARAATEGGHESLDRIPGAALLGAAAARLYGVLGNQAAWLAFHSGRLRFGDGLPLSAERLAYPMPLSWHHPKLDKPDRDGSLIPDSVFNFALDDAKGTEQPEQLRKGYVAASGRWIKPEHGLRLKTAIDRQTGRAAESQLFGYDALARGQCYAARIEAESEFDEALFERVVDALQGEVLLGRSRSAEYGRAHVRKGVIDWPEPRPTVSGPVTLWLLSDLALVDAAGQPTLSPDAHALGLPGGEIVWDRTFLRSRRYSPWNAARHGYDRERLVLTAGGVITLRTVPDLDRKQVERLHAGIGLFREAGLGRVWVNPPLLAGPHPDFTAAEATDAVAPVRPDHPLVAWLERQGVDWKTSAENEAREIANDYAEQVRRARRAAGVAPDADFGPSKAQWSGVLEAARNKSGQALFDALFNGNAALVKPNAEGWQEEAPDGDTWARLADWLKNRLAFTGDPKAYAHKVRTLAHRVRTDIDKRRV